MQIYHMSKIHAFLLIYFNYIGVFDLLKKKYIFLAKFVLFFKFGKLILTRKLGPDLNALEKKTWDFLNKKEWGYFSNKEIYLLFLVCLLEEPCSTWHTC